MNDSTKELRIQAVTNNADTLERLGITEQDIHMWTVELQQCTMLCCEDARRELHTQIIDGDGRACHVKAGRPFLICVCDHRVELLRCLDA